MRCIKAVGTMARQGLSFAAQLEGVNTSVRAPREQGALYFWIVVLHGVVPRCRRCSLV